MVHLGKSLKFACNCTITNCNESLRINREIVITDPMSFFALFQTSPINIPRSNLQRKFATFRQIPGFLTPRDYLSSLNQPSRLFFYTYIPRTEIELKRLRNMQFSTSSLESERRTKKSKQPLNHLQHIKSSPTVGILHYLKRRTDISNLLHYSLLERIKNGSFLWIFVCESASCYPSQYVFFYIVIMHIHKVLLLYIWGKFLLKLIESLRKIVVIIIALFDILSYKFL